MFTNIKYLVLAGLVAAVSACSQPAPQEEYVVVEPEPISMEPMYTGKYK